MQKPFHGMPSDRLLIAAICGLFSNSFYFIDCGHRIKHYDERDLQEFESISFHPEPAMYEDFFYATPKPSEF
jgi:hypothetical protein